VLSKHFSNILIPTDFSPAAWSAIKYGLRVARQEPARLVLLHVYPMQKRNRGRLKEDSKESRGLAQFEKEMRTLCQQIQPSHKNIKLECAVKTGDVDQEILDFLDQEHCDLIIVGVNSNGEDNKVGKHAAKLLELARVPVMMIPNRQLEE